MASIDFRRMAVDTTEMIPGSDEWQQVVYNQAVYEIENSLREVEKKVIERCAKSLEDIASAIRDEI